MASYGMLRRVALVRTDVSEELSASFIRVTIIGELGTTLVAPSNRLHADRVSPLYPQKSALKFADQRRSLSRDSSLAD
jgi:hypothetical protein